MKEFFFKNQTTTNRLWLGVIICALIVISSCKENTILPPDLVPAVDNINTFQQDTFTVITTSEIKDSLLTGGTLNSVNRNADPDYAHAIGAITLDGIFGKTVAGAYVQMRPPAPKFALSGTNQTIDSIVIGVNYLKAYGDTSTAPMQTFSLYRTSANLTVDSAYYEFDQVPYSASDLLATTSVNFNTIATDSPIVDGNKLRPQIRFNLTSTNPFVIDFEQQDENTAFLDYSSFTAWLGGFYIAPDSNIGGTLGYFDTDNATMYVYYRYDNSGSPDTAVAVFPFDPTYCTRFNHITRNYAGSSAQSFVGTNDPQGDSIIFVQGEPGLAGLISFPYIGDFPNAIINKAELSFTVVSLNNYSDTASYNIPDRFQLVVINENGEEEILRDYFEVGAVRVGGNRFMEDIMGVQRIRYSFNISNTIQEAVTTQNSKFKLLMSGARTDYPAEHRVVLRGSSSAVALEKPKLNIIFTKIQR